MFGIYAASQPFDQLMREGNWVPVFANPNVSNQTQASFQQSGQIGWIQIQPNQRKEQMSWHQPSLGYQHLQNTTHDQSTPNPQLMYPYQNIAGQSRNVTQNVTSNQLHQQPRPPLLPTPLLPTPTTGTAMRNPGNYTITTNKVAQPLMEGTTKVRDPRSIRKMNDNIKALKRSANNASLDKHRAKKNLLMLRLCCQAEKQAPPRLQGNATKLRNLMMMMIREHIGTHSSIIANTIKEKNTKTKWSALKHFNNIQNTRNKPNSYYKRDNNKDNNKSNSYRKTKSAEERGVFECSPLEDFLINRGPRAVKRKFWLIYLEDALIIARALRRNDLFRCNGVIYLFK